MDEWIFEYIQHDKKIMNEYPNKFDLEKIKEYFCEWIYSSKIYKDIQISEYLSKIVLDYLTLFIFCVILGPY